MKKQLLMWSTIVLIGFIFNLFYAVIFHGDLLFPYNTTLQHFSDFRMSMSETVGLNPYTHGNTGVYFPINFILAWPLSLIPFPVNLILLLVFFAFFTYFLMLHYTKDIKQYFEHKSLYYSLLLVVFVSFPFLYCMERGNLECILFVFTGLFLCSYQAKRYYLSGFFLAIAVGIKLYPAVFFILLLKDKKFKPLLFSGLVTLSLSFGAILCFSSPALDSIFGMINNQSKFADYMSGGIIPDTSLLSIVKGFAFIHLFDFSAVVHPQSYAKLPVFINFIDNIMSYYVIAVIFLFGLASLYVVKFEEDFWKNIFLLVVCFLTFPTISYDYKLISMLFPFLLFLNKQDDSKFDQIYTCVFGLIFINKTNLILSNMLDIFLMYFMVGLIVYERIYMLKKSETYMRFKLEANI